MKTYFTLTLFLLFNAYVLQSQNLILYDTTNINVIKDSVIILNGKTTDNELTYHVNVKNNSSTDMSVVVKKTVVSKVNGTDTYFCWNEECYIPITILSNPTIISANSIYDKFSSYYNHYAIQGTSVVTYTFFDENNPSDSARVTFVYNVTTNSINDYGLSEFLVMPYPNPANDYIYFENKTSYPIQLTIYNAFGSFVFSDFLDKNRIKFYCMDLPSGVYYYSYYNKNNVLKNGKFFVVH